MDSNNFYAFVFVNRRCQVEILIQKQKKMSQSEPFDEAVEVLRRIENNPSAKDARMPIRGTFIVEDDEIIHSSFDKTTTQALSRVIGALIDSCTDLVRNLDPTDKVEYVRVNVEKGSGDGGEELMVAPEGIVQMVVVQEHQLRDLRKRSAMKEPRILNFFRLDQINPFYPSLDGLVAEESESESEEALSLSESTTATNEAEITEII